MSKLKLEKMLKILTFIKNEIGELRYVGLDHYIGDRIFGGFHYHKKDETSPKSQFIHGYMEKKN